MSETRRLLLEFETDEVGIRAQKDKRVLKALVKAFSDTSDIVRERALMAAIDVGDPTLVNDIVKSLEDEDDDVRIACAQALAFYHQPRTLPDLFKGLKDSNTWVRSHCAAGLSKLMNGPIWARVSMKDVDTLVGGFPDESDDSIRAFLSSLRVRASGVEDYIKWREANFDIEVDVTEFVKALEETPLVLVDVAEAEEDVLGEPAVARPPKTAGISPEIEEILGEIPDEVRKTLPPEDLKRLTPDTARELVDSIVASFPKKEPTAPDIPKKKVKVRKVTKVRRKKKGPTRQDLIDSIPDEVKESVSEEVLKGLTYEELEALVASTTETYPTEEKKAAPKIIPETSEREELLAGIPKDLRNSFSEEMLKRLTIGDLKDLHKTGSLGEKREQELRLEQFTEKYGAEKAEVLVTVSDDMLEGIPAEQLEEMDVETLKALVQALEPS
ncbi:MAG: HEAT repeat domain-containing protein [Promethearchaeota archaeon]